jgi:hypothetical protein
MRREISNAASQPRSEILQQQMISRQLSRGSSARRLRKAPPGLDPSALN